MQRCHVRLSGVSGVESLLRLIHAREDALLPSLAPEGRCEAIDVLRDGDVHRVRARIRTREGSELWIQVEHRDVFAAVRACFDVTASRLERRASRPGMACVRSAPPAADVRTAV